MTSPDSPPALHPRLHSGFGTGTRVWLVRHAEVHADWKGIAYGDLDVPLSQEGEARTREMGRDYGRLLAPDVVVSSPLARALLLGREVAAAAGVELIEDDGLREIHRGRWQGEKVEELHARHSAEVDAFYADPWGWAGHGGECDAALHARAWPVLERAVRRAEGGTALLATHYNTIRVLAAAALGVPPPRSFALRIDTGRAALLVDSPDGWLLVRSNVHTPAPPEGPTA